MPAPLKGFCHYGRYVRHVEGLRDEALGSERDGFLGIFRSSMLGYDDKGAIHSSLVRFVEEGACLQSCYRRTLDQFERPVPVNDKRAILVIWR